MKTIFWYKVSGLRNRIYFPVASLNPGYKPGKTNILSITNKTYSGTLASGIPYSGRQNDDCQ
jgi:hypothetical protein